MTLLSPHRTPAAIERTTKTIVAWGDSLTAGRTAGRNNSYPFHLAQLFEGRRDVVNRGVGAQTAAQICERFLAAPEYHACTAVIWAGTGSLITEPDTIITSLDKMVEALETDHFLVLSTFNTDRPAQWRGTPFHARMTDINRRIGDRFGDHYLDIRSILARSSIDSVMSQQDAEHDVVPSFLRVDRGHLNGAGNQLVAKVVFAVISEWLDRLPREQRNRKQ